MHVGAWHFGHLFPDLLVVLLSHTVDPEKYELGSSRVSCRRSLTVLVDSPGLRYCLEARTGMQIGQELAFRGIEDDPFQCKILLPNYAYVWW